MCKRLFKMQNGVYVFMVPFNFEASEFIYTEQRFTRFVFDKKKAPDHHGCFVLAEMF